uniref:Protein S100-A13 n=3 Tax=Equus TaxID=9789 RepID=F6YZ13_HORSE
SSAPGLVLAAPLLLARVSRVPSPWRRLRSIFSPWASRSLPRSPLKQGFRKWLWEIKSGGGWKRGGCVGVCPSCRRPLPQGGECRSQALPGRGQSAESRAGPCGRETGAGSACGVLGSALCAAAPEGGQPCEDISSSPRVLMAAEPLTELEAAIETVVTTFFTFAGREGRKGSLSVNEFKELATQQLPHLLKDVGSLDEKMKSLDVNQDSELKFHEYWRLIGELAKEIRKEKAQEIRKK